MTTGLINEIVLTILMAGGTLLGALAFKKPIYKILWIVGFGIPTLACVWLSVISYQEAPTAAGIVREVNGATDYAYFKADPDELKKAKGPFQLWAVGRGNIYSVYIWISPASANMNVRTPAYYSIQHQISSVEIINDGSHITGTALPLGDYIIQFRAKNGEWYESLRLFLADGMVHQAVKVTDVNAHELHDVDISQ
jgi:hypothetical protein